MDKVSDAGFTCLAANLKLSTPRHCVCFRSCHDDIVIAGMSCRLPESDSVNEFRENLMSHVDMVTDTESRWSRGETETVTPPLPTPFLLSSLGFFKHDQYLY